MMRARHIGLLIVYPGLLCDVLLCLGTLPLAEPQELIDEIGMPSNVVVLERST